MALKQSEEFQKFLDEQQYSTKGILRYEKIFGHRFVSTGGRATTARFCQNLNLRPGQKVLDVGCGTGGSAFYMARKYGVDVHGVDLSSNMIQIANDYRRQMDAGVKHRVQFHVEDATVMDYPGDFYDVVYSRDTILHIEDKVNLFRRFHHCLKPGGLLLITDYCRGDGDLGQDFKEYVAQRGYHLLTVGDYGRALAKAGFDADEVDAIDNTNYFVEILQRELCDFLPKKEEMEREYSLDDYNEIRTGWEKKIVRCKAGDQAWGYFMARKAFA